MFAHASFLFNTYTFIAFQWNLPAELRQPPGLAGLWLRQLTMWLGCEGRHALSSSRWSGLNGRLPLAHRHISSTVRGLTVHRIQDRTSCQRAYGQGQLASNLEDHQLIAELWFDWRKNFMSLTCGVLISTN
jgi:hypothetical protein